MEVILRLTETQHAQLRAHLFPGDGKEAVAIALCGRRAGETRHCLMVQKIVPVASDHCRVRTPMRVTWGTDLLLTPLAEAVQQGLALVKIHSHPGGFAGFSACDDASDRALFPSIYGWMENDQPHASAIMLPDGRLIGRTVSPEGAFDPLGMVAVVGDDLHFWYARDHTLEVPEFARRHAQVFGAGTTARLRRLAVAVIGCSGTGSPVIEQLARLGVGKLVLVDPDRVEEKNLNRILHATMDDARHYRLKVDVIAQAIAKMGLGTDVIALGRHLGEPAVVRAVAACDVLFGCMDSVDGRHLLNRLATFYLQPYFDVGIKIEADGVGGVEQVCGTVHYLQPGKSSLLSRGTYTMEQVRAAGLRRANPAAYAAELHAKYLVGVQEDRPAVMSVNMQFASLAVNEFLARLHPYRDDDNTHFATYRLSLTQAQLYTEGEGEPCRVLARHVGRGDTRLLLDMPELSEREPQV